MHMCADEKMTFKYWMRLHWKKIIGMIILIAMLSVFIVGKVLDIEWLNDTTIYVTEALLALGFFSYFELGDYTLWYKRWCLRKYKKYQILTLEFKYFDSDLKPHILEKDVEIENILINDSRGIVYVLVYEFYRLYVRINPFTGGATIVTTNNETYKPNKDQYDFKINSSLASMVKDFFTACSPNNEFRSLEINSLKVTKK